MGLVRARLTGGVRSFMMADMKRRNLLIIFLTAAVSGAALLACSLPASLPFLATATPTLTATTTATATATSTPTPTATPTPSPEDLLEAAARDYLYGDWEEALTSYREIAAMVAGQELKFEADLGAGKSLLAMGRYTELHKLMDQVISAAGGGERAAEALLLKAWAFEEVGDDRQAAETYEHILETGAEALRGYVLDWRGDALWETGEYELAGNAYQQALFVEPTSGFVQTEIKLAGTLEDRADFEGAIEIY